MRDDTRESTAELRCVAPLVVLAASGPQLVGPCMLITNGKQTIAIASSEVLRHAAEPLVILTRLDGSSHLPVTTWQLSRHVAIGVIPLPEGSAFTPEIHPLHMASLSASTETRGAPSALITIRAESATRFAREIIGVRVDVDDGGGMIDDITRHASPHEPVAPALVVDGAPLFAWMPPDPVLGRASEVIAVALGVVTRAQTVLDESAAIAELIGFEDVGRALPWAEHTPPSSNELGQVAGEIADDATAPIMLLSKDA